MSKTTNVDARAIVTNMHAVYRRHLDVINQMTLTAWIALAARLGVAKNDREGAARLLMRAELSEK